jgi:glycine cleavage system transcriptional repressor
VALSAVNVLGVDQPGVIAKVTSTLTEHGANIRDSTVTLLGGHVAMMLLVTGDLEPEELAKALAQSDLVVMVSAVEARRHFRVPGSGLGYVLSLHGPDRHGIISAISTVLASVGGNITGMSTRLSGRLYVLIADVDLPARTDVPHLMRRLAGVGEQLGSEITFRPMQPDVL